MDSRRAGGGSDLNHLQPALSVVIPAYNEGANILAVLRAVHEAIHVAPLEVLIVYDFTEDTTVPIVEGAQATYPDVHLILNEYGRGALNALKTGLAKATAPYILVTMADLSDDLHDVDAMYQLATAGGAHVIAGSRYMRGGEQQGGPIIKRTLSRLAGLSLHYVGGIGTHDPTNNFKLYSRELIRALKIESSGGFELALELTVKAHLAGFAVGEVPTRWRDRTAGESRFQVRKWLPHYLRWYRSAMLGRFSRY